ncbi:MAG TPA: competence/damage-inducible protein A [Candidatus Binatia bacterium]
MIRKVAILSTGDELTTGRIVDTNSAYIAGRLYSLGVEVVAVLKVGDTKERLLWALEHGLELGDLVIGTGGLGPTADDLTSEVVAGYFRRPLKMDDEVASALKRRFDARGFPWTANNLKQALFPEGAEILPNPVGTAPGFRIETADKKSLVWLSGVPREMEAMMQQSVLPWIAQASGGEQVSAQTFKIHGLTESKLDDILKPVLLPPGARLSFRAHYPDLTLRLTLWGGQEREKNFSQLTAQIRELLEPHIYGEGDVTLEEIVGELLRKKGWTLALAESLTGGAIGHRITRVASSSGYFKSSIVAYSNEAKRRFLGVKKTTLERHGAVSRETALEMAEGALREAEADIALSVTGIAGPSGGTDEKPVGSVWIGLARRGHSETRHFHFHGDRERVILGASQAALNFLRTALL